MINVIIKYLKYLIIMVLCVLSSTSGNMCPVTSNHFNPIQTQLFHALNHSDRNILFGPDARAIAEAAVIVTTLEKWDGVSRSWQTRNIVQDVALIVIDEIHLLGRFSLICLNLIKNILFR